MIGSELTKFKIQILEFQPVLESLINKHRSIIFVLPGTKNEINGLK